MTGAKVNLSKLFRDDLLKENVPQSISLDDDLDANLETLETSLSEIQLNTVLLLKEVYDGAKLSVLLKDYDYISDAKVALYDQNRLDLRSLKNYVRTYAKDKYRHIFSEKKEKLNNYAAYSRYKLSSGEKTCTMEDFCDFLKKELPGMKECAEMAEIWQKILDKTFLPRLRSKENGLFPYQLHKVELCKIMENAAAYLPFLNEVDPDGHSVKDKIISVFEFKIPYYVGPLNPKSPNAWIVRTGEKIYPWNFSEVVDAETSAEKFLIELVC